jgi:cytochrome c-type biogenesis protein CcmH
VIPRSAVVCALLALVALVMASTPALAVDMTPPLPNDALQQRYETLIHELRCMQCQNEALADSTVSLAADLRLQVRDLLIAGQSDDQVRDFMVARYGEFILFRPRRNWRNAWLWSAPVVFLAFGALAAARVLRRRSRLLADEPDDDPSSPDAARR